MTSGRKPSVVGDYHEMIHGDATDSEHSSKQHGKTQKKLLIAEAKNDLFEDIYSFLSCPIIH